MHWDAVCEHFEIDSGTYATYQLSAEPVAPLVAMETEIGGKKYISF